MSTTVVVGKIKKIIFFFLMIKSNDCIVVVHG